MTVKTSAKVLDLAAQIKNNKRHNEESAQESRMADLDASDKQKARLTEWGIRFDDRPAAEGGISMLKASEIIGEYIAEQTRRREEARAKPASALQIKTLIEKFDAKPEQVEHLTQGEASDLIRALLGK